MFPFCAETSLKRCNHKKFLPDVGVQTWLVGTPLAHRHTWCRLVCLLSSSCTGSSLGFGVEEPAALFYFHRSESLDLFYTNKSELYMQQKTPACLQQQLALSMLPVFSEKKHIPPDNTSLPFIVTSGVHRPFYSSASSQAVPHFLLSSSSNTSPSVLGFSFSLLSLTVLSSSFHSSHTLASPGLQSCSGHALYSPIPT